MMEMLRKAELMVQKKKRQMVNRQIAELGRELENLSVTVETMSVEEYNALREKLRLLPKVHMTACVARWFRLSDYLWACPINDP